MGFKEAELSQDGFLGGKLRVWQPIKGYRAGTDPVFLAAATPVRANQSLLELGCGVGVASLCLLRRVNGLRITGVEVQENYGGLARRNAVENNLEFTTVIADLTALPEQIQQASFDHVIFNPPYLGQGSGTAAKDSGKEIAFREATPLADWVDTGLRRLKPLGYLTVIHLAERLPELLCALGNRVGDIKVKPLTGRGNAPAGRVIVQARKGARGPFTLCPPLVLHQGATHARDQDSFTAEASGILRGGDGLTL